MHNNASSERLRARRLCHTGNVGGRRRLNQCVTMVTGMSLKSDIFAPELGVVNYIECSRSALDDIETTMSQSATTNETARIAYTVGSQEAKHLKTYPSVPPP